jgi:hypothetical protein
MQNTKMRIEYRDEALQILATIAKTMGITISAAGNAMALRYGGHMIRTYKYEGSEEIQSFVPVSIDSVQSQRKTEPVDLSALMEPMEF